MEGDPLLPVSGQKTDLSTSVRIGWDRMELLGVTVGWEHTGHKSNSISIHLASTRFDHEGTENGDKLSLDTYVLRHDGTL